MSNVVRLHSAGPVPVTPPLAEVRHLPTAQHRPAGPPEQPRRTGRPPRRPRNGHHPDCPYPTTPATHCGICRSITIAADPTEETA